MDIRSKKFDSSVIVKEDNAYRFFCKKIKDIVVYNIENKDIGFVFGKVNWESKNVFNFQYVDEKLAAEKLAAEKLTSDSITQKELTNFFTENITEEKMFNNPLEFYRKNSPEHEKIKVYLKKSGF